jgi:hypothetical protein
MSEKYPSACLFVVMVNIILTILQTSIECQNVLWNGGETYGNEKLESR